MKSEKAKGYLLGVVASIAYGLNPFFALPMYEEGLTADSVLTYRYSFAMIMIGVLMLLKGESFKVRLRELPTLVTIGLMFAASSLFLFTSFNYMDSGIAATILFTYPIFVAVTMSLIFHEHISILTILAIAVSFAGICMLYQVGEGGVTLSLTGTILVTLSSLTYAIYIVMVNKSSVKEMSGLKLNFYAMLFGVALYLVRLRGGIDLEPLNTASLWYNTIGIALLPTLISLVFIVKSIHIIGATPAAILGALEPITALVVSVAVFGGHLTASNMVGIGLVLVSVLTIVLGKSLTRGIATLWRNMSH